METKRESQINFVSTIDYLRSPDFAARAQLIKRPLTGRPKDALFIIRRILQAAQRDNILLLASSWGRLHPDLLSAAIIGLMPRHMRPRILLLGCMWEPNNGIQGFFERKIVSLADRSIDKYLVQSSEELMIFPQIWQVSSEKVRFCPFFYELNDEELKAPLDISTDNYVFAGGNSHRDYESLVDAARALPDLQFVFATHLLDGRTDLPANITTGSVSHNNFVGLLRNASATVTAIRSGLHRAAGQRTYLNSMWLKIPTLVTNTLGVNDHITHMTDGIIVDGSPEGYIKALEWVFNPKNQEAVQQLGENAHKTVQGKFTLKTHIERVLSLIDEAAQEN